MIEEFEPFVPLEALPEWTPPAPPPPTVTVITVFGRILWVLVRYPPAPPPAPVQPPPPPPPATTKNSMDVEKLRLKLAD